MYVALSKDVLRAFMDFEKAQFQRKVRNQMLCKYVVCEKCAENCAEFLRR